MVQRKKQFKKTLYNSFVNNFVLGGKKKLAKNIIDNTFLNLSKNLRVSIVQLLFRVYLKLDCFVEIKHVKIKRRKYTIPFAVNYSRRIYLIIKKIKNSTKSDKRRINFSEKLKIELYNIINFQSSSKAIKSSKAQQALVKSSRSNIHFRWK